MSVLSTSLADAVREHPGADAVLVGLVGSGIGPSLSPPLHETEARRLGMRYHYRRIDRHYATTLQRYEGFVYLSQIALLHRTLDRSQLFDTP